MPDDWALGRLRVRRFGWKRWPMSGPVLDCSGLGSSLCSLRGPAALALHPGLRACPRPPRAMLYTLVSVDESLSRADRQRRRLAAFSSFCSCFAVLALLLGSALPMWVVTSYRGVGHVLVVDFSVDLNMGDGLWMRNVCFGGTKPSEDMLNKAGLTCEGTLQTDGCDSESLSSAQRDHCDTFFAAQALESGAIFVALLAWLMGACLSRDRLRFSPSIASLLAAAFALSVIGVLGDSYMFNDSERFHCSQVLGADLCTGYGAALHFQSLGVVACLARVFFELMLACSPAAPEGGGLVMRVPLLQAHYVSENPPTAVQAYAIPQAVRAETAV
jgi:hypothetical protein